jgi:hypothetical protein
MDKKHMMQERSDWHRWVGSDWHRWWGRLALMNGQTAIRIAGWAAIGIAGGGDWR